MLRRHEHGQLPATQERSGSCCAWSAGSPTIVVQLQSFIPPPLSTTLSRPGVDAMHIWTCHSTCQRSIGEPELQNIAGGDLDLPIRNVDNQVITGPSQYHCTV